MEEPDFSGDFEDDDDEPQEPDYYLCSCCGNYQTLLSFGNSCDKCGMFNVMTGEYF